MDPILEQFLTEARDNLAFLDTHLKKLEYGDDDDINALFRAAHTLKGGAGLVGFISVKEITHVAEDLLDALRQKKVAYTPPMLDLLYDVFDEVVELIDASEKMGGVDIHIDNKKLQHIQSTVSTFLSGTKSIQEGSSKPYSPVFTMSERLSLEPFTPEQIATIASQVKQRRQPVTEAFCQEKQYWIVDLDLDVETLKMGNDPFYTFYLLEEGALIAMFTELFHCNEDDLFEWRTHLRAVIYANESMIEDVFYNLLEEARFAPIFLETLHVSSPNDLLSDQASMPFLKEEERQSVLNILLAQKDALQVPGTLVRTKLILTTTLHYLNMNEDIEALETQEKLSSYIDEIVLKLNSDSTKNEHVTAQSEKTIDEAYVVPHKDENKESSFKKESTNIAKTIKIDQEEIDHLMDIVGEILVVKNSLPYIAQHINAETFAQSKRDLMSKYEEISRITDQLQDRVMGMRLLPISYIFSRYPKLVRDISKELGKTIEYIEYGAETKLDKMMIEKIADPLVHLIRNSLDHGIESESERIKAGKVAKGTLKVGARSEGDRVFIDIFDDGKGINTEAVVMKALEKGLVNPDSLDSMSEEEKMKLIFLPGLSTKAVISDLSGRGVGADAVRTTVEELGGKIYLESDLGHYTKTTLEIPVSVALSNVFHLLLGNVNYGLAMEHIVETEKMTKDQIRTASKKPFIRLRGEIIPLILCEKLLARSSFKDEENLLIVRSKMGKLAIVVDSFIGQLNVVQKPLTGSLKNHALINGVSLLGDGSPLLILNVNALMMS